MATSVLPYRDLATEANQFMTGQAIAPYLANLPNYASMVGQRTQNIGSQLKGQLPQDVINQIGQQAAERGVGQGVVGSPNTNAAYLRAIGLNSYQMQQQGGQNLTAAIADTPVPQIFNPMSLFVPEHLAQLEQSAAMSGLTRGGRGTGGSNITPPNLGFPQRPQTPFSMAPGGSAVAYGPSWGSGGAGESLFTGAGASPGGGGMSFMGNMTDYWNSPMGLQDPNRPADENIIPGDAPMADYPSQPWDPGYQDWGTSYDSSMFE